MRRQGPEIDFPPEWKILMAGDTAEKRSEEGVMLKRIADREGSL